MADLQSIQQKCHNPNQVTIAVCNQVRLSYIRTLRLCSQIRSSAQRPPLGPISPNESRKRSLSAPASTVKAFDLLEQSTTACVLALNQLFETHLGKSIDISALRKSQGLPPLPFESKNLIDKDGTDTAEKPAIREGTIREDERTKEIENGEMAAKVASSHPGPSETSYTEESELDKLLTDSYIDNILSGHTPCKSTRHVEPVSLPQNEEILSLSLTGSIPADENNKKRINIHDSEQEDANHVSASGEHVSTTTSRGLGPLPSVAASEDSLGSQGSETADGKGEEDVSLAQVDIWVKSVLGDDLDPLLSDASGDNGSASTPVPKDTIGNVKQDDGSKTAGPTNPLCDERADAWEPSQANTRSISLHSTQSLPSTQPRPLTRRKSESMLDIRARRAKEKRADMERKWEEARERVLNELEGRGSSRLKPAQSTRKGKPSGPAFGSGAPRLLTQKSKGESNGSRSSDNLCTPSEGCQMRQLSEDHVHKTRRRPQSPGARTEPVTTEHDEPRLTELPKDWVSRQLLKQKMKQLLKEIDRSDSVTEGGGGGGAVADIGDEEYPDPFLSEDIDAMFNSSEHESIDLPLHPSPLLHPPPARNSPMHAPLEPSLGTTTNRGLDLSSIVPADTSQHQHSGTTSDVSLPLPYLNATQVTSTSDATQSSPPSETVLAKDPCPESSLTTKHPDNSLPYHKSNHPLPILTPASTAVTTGSPSVPPLPLPSLTLTRPSTRTVAFGKGRELPIIGDSTWMNVQKLEASRLSKLTEPMTTSTTNHAPALNPTDQQTPETVASEGASTHPSSWGRTPTSPTPQQRRKAERDRDQRRTLQRAIVAKYLRLAPPGSEVSELLSDYLAKLMNKGEDQNPPSPGPEQQKCPDSFRELSLDTPKGRDMETGKRLLRSVRSAPDLSALLARPILDQPSSRPLTARRPGYSFAPPGSAPPPASSLSKSSDKREATDSDDEGDLADDDRESDCESDTSLTTNNKSSSPTVSGRLSESASTLYTHVPTVPFTRKPAFRCVPLMCQSFCLCTCIPAKVMLSSCAPTYGHPLYLCLFYSFNPLTLIQLRPSLS